jgi:nitrate/nitrite transport system ATP-binding protein
LQQVLVDLWRRDQKTAIMVTHDVDEAVFLSDRVVMMSNGPAAEIGEILTIPFEHPRNRKELLESAEYYVVRDHLITFLEERAHLKPSLGQAQENQPQTAAAAQH